MDKTKYVGSLLLTDLTDDLGNLTDLAERLERFKTKILALIAAGVEMEERYDMEEGCDPESVKVFTSDQAIAAAFDLEAESDSEIMPTISLFS